MSPPSLTVIKVGGSLFDWPELPRRLTAFLNARRNISSGERIVLIAGGGPSADVVRDFDRIHRLGDLPAHRLALHALDLTAILLAALVPGSRAVDRIESMSAAWNARSIPILAPRQMLIEIDRPTPDPLKASWDVTSDAIAARIAVHLEAQCLVLLKSAPLPSAATRRDAARLGLIDPVLPAVASPLPRVEYLNLREEPQHLQLLPP